MAIDIALKDGRSAQSQHEPTGRLAGVSEAVLVAPMGGVGAGPTLARHWLERVDR